MGPTPTAGPPGRPVYLDHAATSPLRPEVAEAMARTRAEALGNPSGSHRLARVARALLEGARQTVAEVVGAEPGQVVFTSGGTESANLAVRGTLLAARAARPGPGGPPLVVCSAVEHPAVLESCRAAAGTGPDSLGTELALAGVDRFGRVDLGALDRLLSGPGAGRVALVAVMAANNETGVVQPLAEVVALTRQRAQGAAVVTDAVQAAPHLALGALTGGADLVVLSAHKLGGPVGTGVLVTRGPGGLAPLLHGGAQERGRRSGTQDVVGAVGMAEALRLAAAEGPAHAAALAARRDALADGLVALVEGTERTVPASVPTLPGHCHLRFAGAETEELLVALDDEGVCASAGSSCASGALEPSHVLGAMGLTPEQARSSVRFSLGWSTGDDDVAAALPAVARAVARLRGAGDPAA